MSNFFDQFDSTAPAPQAAPPPLSITMDEPTPPGGNFFDRFDELSSEGRPSIATRALAGANTGLIARTVGAPVDLATSALNLGSRAINTVGGAIGHNPDLPDIENPVGGSQSINALLGKAGVGTAALPPPENLGEQLAEQIPEAAASMVGPFGVARITAPLTRAGSLAERTAQTIGSGTVASNAAVGGAAGAGGVAASEAVPDQYKPLADIAGQLLAGGATATAHAAVPWGGRVAAKGIDYFRLPATAAGQEQLAGQRILGAASNPDAARAALSAESAGTPLIPGSNPTTPEVTADPGIAQLARSAIQPENFKTMQGERNAARIGALETTAPAEADPAAVGQLFQQQLDHADRLADAHIAALQQRASAAGEAVGGAGAPQEYGQQMRGLLDQAAGVAKTRNSQLWEAIDPNGNLGVQTGDLRGAIGGIEKAVPSTARPPEGEERAILDTIGKLPDVTPFHDFGALWSRVQAAIRQERMTGGGETPVVRRLGQIRDALSGALKTEVENIASAEKAGAIHADISPVESRLAENQGVYSQAVGPNFAGDLARAYRSSPAALRAATSGGDAVVSGVLRMGDGGNATPAGHPLSPVLRGSGEGKGRPGNAAGNPEVPPGEQSLAPFDQAAGDRYTAAKAGTLDYKQTFRAGPVGQVLAPGPNGTSYRLGDSAVPKKFASTPEGIDAYVKAAGSRPEAVALLHDYLASTLRRLPDGSIDPGAFPRWLDRNRPAVDAFPELKDRFGTAAQAQQAVEDAAASRVAAKKAEARSAATLFVGNDPVTAVRKALSVGGNGEAAFKELADRVKGNPEAEAGLRRAVVQSIRQRMESTVKDLGTGLGFIKNDAFQKFIGEKTPALRHVFSAPQIELIRRIGRDMSQENSFTSGSKMPGSDTFQNFSNKARFSGRPSLLRQLWHGVGDTAVFLALEHAGGIVTGVASLAVKKVAGAMREAGLKHVDDLVEEAMLNPALARTLIAKVTPKNQTDLMARLGNQLRTIAVEAPANAESRQRDSLDAVTRGVAAMAPGTAITARQLAQLSGRSDIADVRNRLVSRGLIAQRNGRYVRADTANAGAALAPAEIAQPKPGLTVNRALLDSVHKAIQQRAPTLRRQSLQDLGNEIEARPSPYYGTYRPGGLLEHTAAVGQGSPMTHDVVNLLRRSGGIPREEWSKLAAKGEDWAKRLGIEGPSPSIRREEAVAQAYNRWRAGEMRLPPGLRRIMGNIPTVATA